CAAERIHAQARVVTQRRQAGGACGVARLDQGILDERQPGFLGLPYAELRLRAQNVAVALEQFAQLRELARVAAGQDQLRGVHGQAASAACCAANSWSQPRVASASIASSSSRRNAWPSAVPCTSMKPPPSFITTFMSVSQSQS